jgi:thiopurine S-methyltransferase
MASRGVIPKVSAAFTASVAKKKWWKELFREGQDAFTLPDVNPHLRRHWPLLSGGAAAAATAAAAAAAAGAADAPPARCLVPLCGRDISLTWLASQPGWGAVGVDFADDALRLLDAETGGIVPLGSGQEGEAFSAFQSSRYPRLLLAHGDFMALRLEHYGGPFEAAWDRGGLTAMGGAAARSAYAARLASLLAPGGRLLLEMLDTNIEMEGACAAEEAQEALGGAGLRVRQLEAHDVRAQYPSFSPPGLRYLREVLLFAERPLE